MSASAKAPFELERPEKASMTLLQHVDRCPYSASLYLKHKGATPQTAPMARGEAFHDFAERAIKMLMEKDEPSMPPEVAKDLMQAVIEERTDLNLPAPEQEACRIMAWNWGRATVLDIENIVCVETMLEMTLGGWTIRGRIDYSTIVGSECFVKDWKSSLGLPSPEDFENSWQAPFYALLHARGVPEGETVPIGRGVSGFHLANVYPRIPRDDGTMAERSAFYDRAMLHDFQRTVTSQLRKLDHGLGTGEWVAQPGSQCATCPAPQECPIAPELREVPSIGAPGEAAEIGERVIRLETEAKAAKKALKAWVDENGPIIVGDLVFDYGYTRSESLTDRDGIKAAVESAGADPEQFFSVRESTPFRRRKVRPEDQKEAG